MIAVLVVLAGVAVLFYIFHILFFWIFPSTDSIFYWLLSDFFKTGIYLAPHPYYYREPSTMEPPLYSVFIFIANLFPRADIIIHIIQVAAIIASGILIYKIQNHSFSKKYALLSAVLFLFTPAHLIYISNMVAESLAVFYISLFLYFLHLAVNLRNKKILPIMLVYSALISLHRYNLVTFFLLTLFLIFREKGKLMSRYLGLSASLAVFGGWILLNHQWNGSWGLSNSEGKHLYNRILHFDRILPPNTHPSFIKFRQLAGERDDYFKPWWFYEEALITSTGSETKASLIMQEFALAALISNPLKYIINTPKFFLFAHWDNPTYHDDLYLYGGNMKNNCGKSGNIFFCRPIIKTEYAFKFWDALVILVDFIYLNLAKFFNIFLLFPALIYAILKKDRFFRYVSLLYIASITLFVMVEAPLPRYTYIFTPIPVILVTYFSINIPRKIFVKKIRNG